MKTLIAWLLQALTALLVLFWVWIFVQLLEQCSADSHAGIYNLQTEAGQHQLLGAIALLAIAAVFFLGLVNMMVKGPEAWRSFSFIFFLLAASPVALLFFNIQVEKNQSLFADNFTKPNWGGSTSNLFAEAMPAPGPPGKSTLATILTSAASHASSLASGSAAENAPPPDSGYVDNGPHIHDVPQPVQRHTVSLPTTFPLTNTPPTPGDKWTWQTSDGTVYDDVVIEKIEPGQVSIMYENSHSVGHTTVKTSDLPAYLQAQVQFVSSQEALENDTASATPAHQANRAK
jgi:hypothetical protein